MGSRGSSTRPSSATSQPICKELDQKCSCWDSSQCPERLRHNGALPDGGAENRLTGLPADHALFLSPHGGRGPKKAATADKLCQGSVWQMTSSAVLTVSLGQVVQVQTTWEPTKGAYELCGYGHYSSTGFLAFQLLKGQEATAQQGKKDYSQDPAALQSSRAWKDTV